MKRMTTYVMTLFFSVGLFAQQQKPQQTQFYQSLITVSEGVLYTNAQSFLASTSDDYKDNLINRICYQ